MSGSISFGDWGLFELQGCSWSFPESMNWAKTLNFHVIFVVLFIDVISHCQSLQSQLGLGLELLTSHILSCTSASTFALAGALGPIAVYPAKPAI